MINLYINERRAGDVSILDLKGRLRVGGNTVALHRSIRSLVLEKKTLILLNLAGVTFIDSCGLGELVASQVSVENKGGEIKLFGLTDTLRELLTATSAYSRFSILTRTKQRQLESFANSSSSASRRRLLGRSP